MRTLGVLFALLLSSPLAHAATGRAKNTPAPNKSQTAKADEDESDNNDEDQGDDDDDTPDPHVVSGNVTLASDYLVHGLTQTSHEPALQGGFDWAHPVGAYIGVWGSNVHSPT